MLIRSLYIVCLVMIALPGISQSSVLSSGRWYKVAVDKNGVYRITQDQFKKMGFDPAKTDPRKIKVYGMAGGMLPQANATPRPDDLVELAIDVKGESDGVFNKEDFILFYGEGANRVEFRSAKKIFFIEHNLYSDQNYYFITVSDTNGKRVQQIAPGGSGTKVIESFQDYVFYEKDEYNELKSGREWYGERFDLTTEHSFTFDVDGISGDAPMYFVSDVMAQSVNPSSFKIFFNNQQIGEQIMPVTPTSTYGVKGRHKTDTLAVDPTAVSADQQIKQNIRFSFTRGSSGRSVGFLNFFSIHFTRKLSLYGNQTIFRNAESQNHSAEYRVKNMVPSNEIWNITNPYEPNRQEFTLENGVARYTEPPEGGNTSVYIVFNNKHLSPQFVGTVSNQNLRGLATPHYVIITAPAFKAEAERLATHRNSINNWTSTVVTPEEIYNEFSSGRQDVTAIRDFVRHLYKKNPQTLQALLLFGKCSYDYKNRLSNNTNLVPTYESRNSLSPLETYSSDDYFGFLETHEGEWGENNFLQNHTLDIGVGRLPVKTPKEAKAVTDKLIDYDKNNKRFGRWRKDIVFVADDGSNSDGFTSIHQSQANALAENIEWQNSEFNTRKIFLGTYQKNVSPNGESIPKASEDISREFNQAVIINYTGHGSEKLWADERVLTQEIIEALDNRWFPFLVTATCEFGRHDNPAEISSAEVSVLRDGAGSIGLVTTTRPVNSSTNFSLNAAFYNALIHAKEERNVTIGNVFRDTKNNSTSGVANRNFSLLGDPAMKLALPDQEIVVDEIKTLSGSDTLKALSKVRVKGRIVNEHGETDDQFSGVLNATLFDKRTRFATIGRNNPAFSFEQWFNPLFRGDASVTDGSFEFEFIMPRNIAYEFNVGKLSLYAVSADQRRDASGASSAFKIGGSEVNPGTDNSSPIVRVFLGDTTFIEGGTVSPDTELVVHLADDSGINISNYGIGNTMMAILDNDREVYLINEHFVAERDNYTRGWVHYPLKNLSPGPHTVTVKVWDTHNNPGEKSVNFVVSEEGAFIINSFVSFPNPFGTSTTLSFTHNRPGEDLRGVLTVVNAAGQEMKVFDLDVPASSYEIRLPFEEDPGKKLLPGIYFGRLRIRSLSDGAGSERVIKLIVAN